METDVQPELNLRIRKGPILRYKLEKNGIFRPELNLRNSKLSGKVLNYGKNLKNGIGKMEKWKNGKLEKVGKATDNEAVRH